MTTVPGSPVWELVKKNSYFLIKQFGNSNTKVQYSKEPNSLYNVHSYKFSGPLANSKTVAVQPSAGEDMVVVLSTTKTKKQNTPTKLQHKTLMHKEFRKMAKSVKNQLQQRVFEFGTA
ncbi:60S ribosomal protein L28-1-like [Triticum aestivum]|uniref:60S ribosomal protein L28-1-like n=1 Tax=Triticum aestivum TaxID=4565 RepID=UPI001D023FDC|nr:60S ribosomal protein L28-1-like [Triticum aestivum]